MLENTSLNSLKNKKNLLAFSGGVDSTALFFLLLKHNITFDIAIVDYEVRAQSKDEVTYAKSLASIYNLECHIHTAKQIQNNFEAEARKIRYDFFEELIAQHKYENLITAHHLGDRFEWMLMQFCKGAGCAEIAGMTREQKREGYTLIRPLLHLDKQELLTYLNAEKIKYFEDETNLNIDIKRNLFRHTYSMPLMEKYLNGIKKSFQYIDEDREALIPEITIKNIDNFAYFKSTNNKRADIYMIDKYLKSLGFMPSTQERELLKNESTSVLGRKFLINQDKGFVFIVPFSKEKNIMTKKFKETCRVLKIEPKLRAYLFENQEAFAKIKELLS